MEVTQKLSFNDQLPLSFLPVSCPKDVALIIFKYFNINDLSSISRVNKSGHAWGKVFILKKTSDEAAAWISNVAEVLRHPDFKIEARSNGSERLKKIEEIKSLILADPMQPRVKVELLLLGVQQSLIHELGYNIYGQNTTSIQGIRGSLVASLSAPPLIRKEYIQAIRQLLFATLSSQQISFNGSGEKMSAAFLESLLYAMVSTETKQISLTLQSYGLGDAEITVISELLPAEKIFMLNLKDNHFSDKAAQELQKKLGEHVKFLK
jgi:hypothetical protein